MKRKATIITEEFDKDGKIVNRTTETTEEEDSGYIYPQYPAYPWWPSTSNPLYPATYTTRNSEDF